MWRHAQTDDSMATLVVRDSGQAGAAAKSTGKVFSPEQRNAIKKCLIFPVTSMVCAENGTADSSTPGLFQAKKSIRSHPEHWMTFRSMGRALKTGASSSRTTVSTGTPKDAGGAGSSSDEVADEGLSSSNSGAVQPPPPGGIQADDAALAEILKDPAFERENPAS
jgi:hypothetical protein